MQRWTKKWSKEKLQRGYAPGLIFLQAACPINDSKEVTTWMVVHNKIEGGVVLEGILERSQKRTRIPCHNISFSTDMCSLQTEI